MYVCMCECKHFYPVCLNNKNVLLLLLFDCLHECELTKKMLLIGQLFDESDSDQLSAHVYTTKRKEKVTKPLFPAATFGFLCANTQRTHSND